MLMLAPLQLNSNSRYIALKDLGLDVKIPTQDPADPDATGKLQGYGPCGAQGPHCGSEKRAGAWNLDLDLLFWGRM
jgi:hypothetical protein